MMNTIEHPTWAETEYENIKRREVRVSILSHLAVALAIFGLLLLALSAIRDIARRISGHNTKPSPAIKMDEIPKEGWIAT